MEKNNEMNQGPSWDITKEYTSLESHEIKADLNQAQEYIAQIEEFSSIIQDSIENLNNLSNEKTKETIKVCQNISKISENTSILISNVSTYANCIVSVDGKNEYAKQMIVKTQELFSKLEQAHKSFYLFLSLMPESFLSVYLNNEETKHQEFIVNHNRKKRDFFLSLSEENLSTALAINGFTAWGNLYDSLSSVIECEVKLPSGTELMGIAKASAYLQEKKEEVRKAAFQAINIGWEKHSESCAAALNSIAGWRLEQYKKRSKKSCMNYLTEPLHNNRISQETLDALFSAVNEAKNIGKSAVQLRAKAFGKEKLHPSDLFAPPPPEKIKNSEKIPFKKAMEIIIEAFNKINPEMGKFAHMMQKNNWIEGTISNNKRPGAYCTSFEKSRTPRVYMTYMGGMKDVSTLAHELGHAFHSWVMRDLPYCQLSYPMNLAETASIFAETVVKNFLANNATSSEEIFSIAWEEAESAEAFLLNIPARFTFEKEFYEKREHSNLSITDFKQLMKNSWQNYYGDTLSEMNEMFWASKLHFYITELSFYNFPYTFGYLFSLGVYAQKEKLGNDFYQNYVNLLRDTGRMGTEELVKKHLGKDITKPLFWQESIQIIQNNLAILEKSLAN